MFRWMKQRRAAQPADTLSIAERQAAWQALRDDPARPPEVCACICHMDLGVMHIKPCCKPCPICHMPIRDGLQDAHAPHCGQYRGPGLATRYTTENTEDTESGIR